MASLIELVGITKRFPGVLANDGVDISVDEARVHCIIGENGAGKTTAMNILYGLYRPDEGKIIVNGSEVEFRSPRDAIQLGIGMVHQEFMLVPSLTVLENIFLGLETSRYGGFLDLATARQKVESIITDLGLPVPLMEKVNRLPVSIQQRVEIVKLLYRGANILILDEPTAVLAPQEVDSLFQTIRALREIGKTIIFITHKLREVMEISDNITIMRDGRVVGNTTPDQTSERQLAQLMVGRDTLASLDKASVEPGNVVLTIKNLWVKDNRGNWAIQDLSLDVRQGEIFGIAGVAGNGQHELAEALFGLRKVQRGSIYLKGNDITHSSPSRLRKMGMTYIPQDRIGVGSALSTSILKNVIMGHHLEKPIASGLLLDLDEAHRFSGHLFKDYDVRLVDSGAEFSNLSGGNKQKTIVGRELVRNPVLLMAEDPTRGVDIGATGYIRQTIVDETEKGMAVLLISQDLQEVIAMSDRVGVMFEGKLVANVARCTLSETEIGLLMTGGQVSQEVIDR